MYIPKHFREEDKAEILDFMKKNEFATLVVFDGEKPVASHLITEIVEAENDMLFINGHMSKANPLWKTFEKNYEALVIYQGAHTFVSASWYNHVNVPTWNYMSIHAYGHAHIVTDQDEYLAMLKRLVTRHESAHGANSPYRLEALSQEDVSERMKGTVGFQIEVTRLEAAYKLSQNRADEDHRNIIEKLEERADEPSHAIAEAMKRIRP